MVYPEMSEQKYEDELRILRDLGEYYQINWKRTVFIPGEAVIREGFDLIFQIKKEVILDLCKQACGCK